MNARERMLCAMNREPVDRVPTDIWATPEVWKKLTDHFGDYDKVFSGLRIDGMAYVGAAYTGPESPPVSDGESVDYWGIRRKRVPHPDGTYIEQTFYPLASAHTFDDIDEYRWPSADWFDYSRMREHAEQAQGKQVVQCGYMAPFYFHNMLRGLEQSLVDPLVAPELTHEVLGRITEFFYQHHRRMFEACEGLIDVAQVTDDLGGQNGPLISVEVYDQFYAPHHKRLIGLCHEFGIKVMHHDDGAIRAFLPRLIALGIDILNPVQWSCPGMELTQLKTDFGAALCFHGGIENQSVLPFGTEDEVRAEVRHCIDALASDGTGYILAPCHSVQVNTPVQNIIAVYDEAWRYGRQ